MKIPSGFKRRGFLLHEECTADIKTDTWIQSDTSFEIKGESPVIPEPAAGCQFHDITAGKFDNNGEHNNGQKNLSGTIFRTHRRAAPGRIQ